MTTDTRILLSVLLDDPSLQHPYPHLVEGEQCIGMRCDNEQDLALGQTLAYADEVGALEGDKLHDLVVERHADHYTVIWPWASLSDVEADELQSEFIEWAYSIN